MFNENKPHFWFPSPDAPVIINVFHFFPNLLLSKNFTEEKYGFLYSLYSNHFSHLLLESGSEINGEISALLDTIYFEFTREKLSYQIMIIAKLLEMSSSLIRYLNSQAYAQANTPFPVKKYTGYNSVNEAIDFINTNYLDPKLTAAQISQHISMNSNSFSSLFKKSMGLTISDYIGQLRISKSIELFANPNLSITEISHLCGYETFSSYYRTFVRIFGISPSEYKKSHKKSKTANNSK
jgi:AraC-like DNA-binding protein